MTNTRRTTTLEPVRLVSPRLTPGAFSDWIARVTPRAIDQLVQRPVQRLLLDSPRHLPVWARWCLAAAMVGVVALIRICTLGPIGVGWPAAIFFPVVVVSSLWLASGSGYIAAILSSVIIVWAFVPPLYSFTTLENDVELAEFLLNLGENVFVAWLIETVHKLVRNQRKTNVQLAQAIQVLRESESEKTMLLREAAHRTRNDFQRLVSTVTMQERRTQESDNAHEALTSVRQRIEAAAALHARLSEMTSHGRTLSVDSQGFLSGIVDDLSATFGLRPIALITMAEAHTIPVQQATSLGLIVNEAVTNAFKYAFPDDRSGQIQILFQRDTDGFLLAIEDDGVGMPAHVSSQGNGLGSRIIRALSAQLHGSVCLARPLTGGTSLKVHFPDRR